MERELFLTMPWPPSVNNIYKHYGKRVYLTEKAKNFKKIIAWDLKQSALSQMKNFPIKETVEILISGYPPDLRRRDDDNINKILSDLLIDAEILEDDFLIRKRTTEIYLYDKSTKNWGVNIKIKPFKQSKGIF